MRRRVGFFLALGMIGVGCATGLVDSQDDGGAVDGAPPDTGACTAMCDGGCADLKTDPSNCGKCGKACWPGATCVLGACQCTGGKTQCGAACADLMTDTANCGKCGISCGGDASIPGGGTWACVGGACRIVCPSSEAGAKTECSGACVDTQTDNDNCGSCGNACAMGTEQCTQGLCCKTGETVCNGGADGGGPQCTDTQSDANNCGMCGKACPMNMPACSGGQCIACGNDCWGSSGCLTNGGHCIRFACRAGSAGGTFCNQCMGWSEITYNDWVSGGWCQDVFAKYYAVNPSTAMCGSTNQNCCATKSGCGAGNVYWHFFDGTNNRYSGPSMYSTPQTANCTVASGTDNSSYARLSVCKKN